MNAREALDYLHRITVIEPTVADEQAKAAISALRFFFDALECLYKDVLLDRGQDERLLAEEMRVASQGAVVDRRGR